METEQWKVFLVYNHLAQNDISWEHVPDIYMMNLLSEPEVGHNLTIIIHRKNVLSVSPAVLSSTAFFSTAALLLSAFLFNRVLVSQSCTAFWTERWVNSNKTQLFEMFTVPLCHQIPIYLTPPVCHTLLTLLLNCLPTAPPLPQVQSEIKRKWRRWMLQRFLGADTKYQQPSIGSNGNNFSTQITMLTKYSPTTRRASACQEHLSAIWSPSKVDSPRFIIINIIISMTFQYWNWFYLL